jgi:hypothetical protein
MNVEDEVGHVHCLIGILKNFLQTEMEAFAGVTDVEKLENKYGVAAT